jgi:hypothetical protein
MRLVFGRWIWYGVIAFSLIGGCYLLRVSQAARLPPSVFVPRFASATAVALAKLLLAIDSRPPALGDHDDVDELIVRDNP